jgi:hypothetical protein
MPPDPLGFFFFFSYFSGMVSYFFSRASLRLPSYLWFPCVGTVGTCHHACLEPGSSQSQTSQVAEIQLSHCTWLSLPLLSVCDQLLTTFLYLMENCPCSLLCQAAEQCSG